MYSSLKADARALPLEGTQLEALTSPQLRADAHAELGALVRTQLKALAGPQFRARASRRAELKILADPELRAEAYI